MSAPVLLGLDPSLTAFGWALAHVSPDGAVDVIEAGCVRTAPRGKPSKREVAADDSRRIGELVSGLLEVVGRRPIAAVALEAPRGSRSARAGHALGIARGVACTLLSHLDLPTTHVLPEAAKLELCGSSTADKAEMVAAARRRWPAARWPESPKAAREGAADAAAVAAAAGKVVADLLGQATPSEPHGLGDCGREACRGVSRQVNHDYCRRCRDALAREGARQPLNAPQARDPKETADR